MEWDQCIICQTDTSENLKCPVNGPRNNALETYEVFLQNAKKLKDLDRFPQNVDLNLLNHSSEELVNKRASWHKVCHMKFSNEKVKRGKQKRKHTNTSDPDAFSRLKRFALDKTACIFCCKNDGELHNASTLEIDKNVKDMALKLEDGQLLSRLAGGDMIALEAKYHAKCLVALRTKYRTSLRRSQSNNLKSSSHLNERAFIETMSHIEDCVAEGDYVFKLSDLYHKYSSRVEALGGTTSLYKLLFKTKMLQYFPNQVQEQFDGKNTVFLFKQGLSSFIRQSLKHQHFDSTIGILTEAASVVRSELFNSERFTFSGDFPPDCQKMSVPESLLCLVSSLINGASSGNECKEESQACLTISQLILFNSKKRITKDKTDKNNVRHRKEREPPLPLYVGLTIHSLTRSRVLITKLANLGLSVTYDRILDISSSLASSVCDQFLSEGVVCPTNMRRGLYTVGAIDNIDHNPSSTTATNSFHGTGISVFQVPTRVNIGTERRRTPLSSGRGDSWLSEEYTLIPAASCKLSNLKVPKRTVTHEDSIIVPEKLKEYDWLNQGKVFLDKVTLEKDDYIGWAAYHANRQEAVPDLPAISGMLPLFYEKAATVAMVKHGMHVVKMATEFLNPGQIPVTAFDQPLFALAKMVQWKWPENYGEDKHIVMFGGLHIEMALWNTLGNLLDGSGWTTCLSESSIVTPGTAESMIKCSHLSKTRHAHQVTALALSQLEKEAFTKQEEFNSEGQWKISMREKSPTFKFWDTILELQLLILMFVRAHREGNFNLYVECMEELTPLFFALDHVNYARWLPVHINDMKTLPTNAREVLRTHWTIPKSKKTFSSIPIDQAHEQNNAILKAAGGVVGLTENPTALRRWMLCGPELTRLMTDFEMPLLKESEESSHHHEQGPQTQTTFQQQVKGFCSTVREMGNPFEDAFEELVTLDTRTCKASNVATAVNTFIDTGRNQYRKYVKEVLEEQSQSIHDPIKRNSLPLFKDKKKSQKQVGQHMQALKTDCSLFSKLYIATQHREGDLESFFAHENHQYPPSLSDFGKIHFGKKSDLINCMTDGKDHKPPDEIQGKVFDGPAIVHALPVASMRTFDEYANQVFIPFVSNQLRDCCRVDIVWDTYQQGSIKQCTREKRGHGVRRKVNGQGKLPSNWKDFLQDSHNKQELFTFLNRKIEDVAGVQTNKKLMFTSGFSVQSVGGGHTMSDSDHEEADTRILVHVLDMLQSGLETVSVRTVDTDVLVLLVGKLHDLLAVQPRAQIWTAFGMGKSFRHFHINAICQGLPPSVCQSLPSFHAFSGCDTTSAFFGKGKKTCWDAWRSYPEVTEAFLYIQEHPFTEIFPSSGLFSLLERYTVVIYDRTSDSYLVNEARRELFIKKNRALEYIPPTQDALLQHVKRCVYQASIWSRTLESKMIVPSPSSFGWTMTGESWRPLWSLLPEAQLACKELVKCMCKKGCTKRCKCKKSNLKCTELCKCLCVEE